MSIQQNFPRLEEALLVSALPSEICCLSTLVFLINVMDGISVMVGKIIERNKSDAPNKHDGGNMLGKLINVMDGISVMVVKIRKIQ